MRGNNRLNHFLEMPMYRRHFSGVTVSQKHQMPDTILPNIPCLESLYEEALNFVPEVFDGVHFWTICEVHSQFAQDTRISHAWPKQISSQHKNMRLACLDCLSWSSDHTILLSFLTACFLAHLRSCKMYEMQEVTYRRNSMPARKQR